jgi:phage tail P2-like protein
VTSLLPPSTTANERRLSAGLSLSPLEIAADRIAALWDADTCPAQCLPALAWALRVDEWSDAWPEEVRRQVCRDAIYLHRRRGTRASIERALRTIGLINDTHGYTARIIEGITALRRDGTALRDGTRTRDEESSWASYEIRLNRPITLAQGASARRVLDATAPARCTLLLLDFSATAFLRDGTRLRDATITYGAA